MTDRTRETVRPTADELDVKRIRERSRALRFYAAQASDVADQADRIAAGALRKLISLVEGEAQALDVVAAEREVRL